MQGGTISRISHLPKGTKSSRHPKIPEFTSSSHMVIACVARVSVGLSACLKHSSLFERAKIEASAKKIEKGGGGREERKRLLDCQVINPSIKSGMFI